MAENMIVAKWHKELEIFYRIKSSIILEGNIYDSFRFPEGRRARRRVTADDVFCKL